MTVAPARLEVCGVSKRFPGVQALDHVTFDVRHAEIHAVAGENGAGKSTLVKVIAGLEAPDAGELRFDGRPLRLRGARDARDRGINTIHQELQLAPDLTGAENIFLGRFPRTPWGLIDRRQLLRHAAEAIGRLGVRLDVRQPVSSMGIAQRQIVEIARALVQRSTVLILDEPSAVLGRHDLQQLFQVLRALRSEGVSILYISHRLEEIFEIADRVTVLRDGRCAGTCPTSEISKDTLIAMMTGRAVDDLARRSERDPGTVALEVRGLARNGVLRDVSFEIRRGEILGLAGKVGSGRTEVARAIFGADVPDAGVITVFGRAERVASPHVAVRLGIGLVPEDRKSEGLLPVRSVLENITLASLHRFLRAFVLRRRAEMREVASIREALGIRTSSLGQQVRYLSGGNQQKTILARWLSSGCRILILDEPTRGVDVGARAEIYALMERFVRDGGAILMISSDVSELLGMADRVAVMRQGTIAGVVSRTHAAPWPAVDALMES